MRRWDRLLETYIEEYTARGISPDTIANVRRELERWGQWLKRRRPRPRVEQIDAELIISYLRGRSAFKSKATIYGVLSKLRGMGDFLVRQELWVSNPLRWMKGPKITPYHRLPKRIDVADMQALWRTAAARRAGYRQHLWVTILAMLYGTGLRRGELARLDLASWSRAEATLRIDGRKTGRQRCVPVPEIVFRCLEAYLPHRHNHLAQLGRLDKQALFINRDGEPLSGESISVGVRTLARRAGVRIHSLHQFRHTCASDLLQAGVRLPEVQRILGHQGISTTVRYLHIADPQRREAMRLHPINDYLEVA